MDVLVVGCGALGVCALRALVAAGYEAFAIERNTIGGGQSCHSHVYIHHGHVYAERDVPLVAKLSSSRDDWASLLADPDIRIESDGAFFGFESDAARASRTAQWDRHALTYVSCPVPDSLAKGAVKYGFRTPEPTLNGGSLMRALSREVIDRVSQSESIERVTLVEESYGLRLESVLVRTPRGLLEIAPRVLLSTAGHGNADIAARLSSKADPRTNDAQMTRKAHMLVIRGPIDLLPAVSGVFPDIGDLFIGVRHDDDGNIVWLVSDARSPVVLRPSDWDRHDARWWLPEVIRSLRRLAPNFFENSVGLSWGIYEAPKAEPSSVYWPDRLDRIEAFGSSNLLIAWPTKLTLAPMVARELVSRVRLLTKPTNKRADISGLFVAARQSPGIADEYWRRTYMHSWDSFSRTYALV